eukprot:RCo010825
MDLGSLAEDLFETSQGSPCSPVEDQNTGASSLPNEEEAEREWPFTWDEVQTAVRVLEHLKQRPELFLSSAKLRETGLQWMITRGRTFNRTHHDTFDRLEKDARKQTKLSLKQADAAKKRQAVLRRERDQALQRLLLEGDGADSTGKLCGPPPAAEACPREGLAASSGSPASVAPNGDTAATDGAGPEEGPSADGASQDQQYSSLSFLQKCHICKHAFSELHFFYFAMCPPCAELNWAKRNVTADLTGRTVLLTGSRMKIGQQICLSLLRAGATVIATTRFAVDMAQRYSQMEDYPSWKNRLHIYRLDLRNLWLVQQFCAFLVRKYDSLFAIVNNAAQTVARPPVYYSGLIEKEIAASQITSSSGETLPNVDSEWDGLVQRHVGIVYHDAVLFASPSAMLQPKPSTSHDSPGSAVPSASGSAMDQLLAQDKQWFDMYDTRRTALDRRTENSWTQTLDQVDPKEAAEVHAINALAPMILNSQLKPLLVALTPGETAETKKRYIINVSAMEGQFYRFKTDRHPHTNMAKAALNMMTRTSAQGYAKDRIFMNSVDTGWISDENPQHKQLDRHSRGLLCPLDEVDAAARVLDLIYIGSEEYGKFWKDYRVVPW